MCFHSTGYGLPQQMWVLAVFTVHVCTGHGFFIPVIMCYHGLLQLAMIPAIPQLPCITQNMFVMRHTVTYIMVNIN